MKSFFKYLMIYLGLHAYLMVCVAIYMTSHGCIFLPWLMLIWTFAFFNYFDHIEQCSVWIRMFAVICLIQSSILFANVVFRSSISMFFPIGISVAICICLLQKFPYRVPVFALLVWINVMLALMPYDLYWRHTGSWGFHRGRIIVGLPNLEQQQEIREGKAIWHGCMIKAVHPPREIMILTF